VFQVKKATKKWTQTKREVAIRDGRLWGELKPEERQAVWQDRVEVVVKSSWSTPLDPDASDRPLRYLADDLGLSGGSSDPLKALVVEVVESLGPLNSLGFAETGEHYNVIERDPDKIMRHTFAYLRHRLTLTVNRVRSERLKAAALLPAQGLEALASDSAPSAEAVYFDGDNPFGPGWRFVPPTRRRSRLSVTEAVESYKGFSGTRPEDVFAYVRRAEDVAGRELTQTETTDIVREGRREMEWWQKKGRPFLAQVFGVDPEHDDFARRLVCFPLHGTDSGRRRHRDRVKEEATPLSRSRREAWVAFHDARESGDAQAIERAGREYVRASDALVAAWARVFMRTDTSLQVSLAEAERLYGRCEFCRPDERTCKRDGCEVAFRPDHDATRLCPEHRRPRKIGTREVLIEDILARTTTEWVAHSEEWGM
jgi:hypothetical protein